MDSFLPSVPLSHLSQPFSITNTGNGPNHTFHFSIEPPSAYLDPVTPPPTYLLESENTISLLAGGAGMLATLAQQYPQMEVLIVRSFQLAIPGALERTLAKVPFPNLRYVVTDGGRKIIFLRGNAVELAEVIRSYPDATELIIQSLQDPGENAIQAALAEVSFPNLIRLDVSADNLPEYLANIIQSKCPNSLLIRIL